MGGGHLIHLPQTGESFQCGAGETRLQGMARIGRKCIPVGCLNGGCGVCKVAVQAGSVHPSGRMSRAHISEQEEARGVVLACRVVPDGEVSIEVVGTMRKAFATPANLQTK